MSSAYTSFKATVSSSALSSGDDLCSTTLFPSMTNRFIACVSTPSTTFTPKSSATLAIAAADLGVGHAGPQLADRSLAGGHRGLHDIRLLAGHGSRRVTRQDDGVGDDGDVAVHVRAEVDLHRLALFQDRGVVVQGGVVAHLVVHGDARRERRCPCRSCSHPCPSCCKTWPPPPRRSCRRGRTGRSPSRRERRRRARPRAPLRGRGKEMARSRAVSDRGRAAEGGTRRRDGQRRARSRKAGLAGRGRVHALLAISAATLYLSTTAGCCGVKWDAGSVDRAISRGNRADGPRLRLARVRLKTASDVGNETNRARETLRWPGCARSRPRRRCRSPTSSQGRCGGWVGVWSRSAGGTAAARDLSPPTRPGGFHR